MDLSTRLYGELTTVEEFESWRLAVCWSRAEKSREGWGGGKEEALSPAPAFLRRSNSLPYEVSGESLGFSILPGQDDNSGKTQDTG